MTRPYPSLFNCTLQQSSSWLARVLDADLTQFWMKGIKAVLSLLIMTILVGLAGGVLRIFLNLETLFTEPLEQVFRQLIVDTLIILAIVEVFNLTNHDNFKDPSSGGTFLAFDGTIRSGLGEPRQVQAGVRYIF